MAERLYTAHVLNREGARIWGGLGVYLCASDLYDFCERCVGHLFVTSLPSYTYMIAGLSNRRKEFRGDSQEWGCRARPKGVPQANATTTQEEEERLCLFSFIGCLHWSQTGHY
jgi:hypothetical protein